MGGNPHVFNTIAREMHVTLDPSQYLTVQNFLQVDVEAINNIQMHAFRILYCGLRMILV